MTIPRIVDGMDALIIDISELYPLEHCDGDILSGELNEIKNKFKKLSEQIHQKKRVHSIIQRMCQRECVFPYPWKKAIDVKIYSMMKMEEALNSLIDDCERVFNIKAIDKLVRNGHIDNALVELGKILSTSPWDNSVHEIVSAMANDEYPSYVLKQIEGYQNNFRLKYLKTVGQGILREPQSMNISSDDKFLFVSDQTQNVVHRFTIEGEYIGVCDSRFHKPHGMCNDNNNVWICDYLGQRLVLVDIDGRVKQDIGLVKFCDNEYMPSYPYAVCIYHNDVFVLVSDVNGSAYALLRFSQKNWNEISVFSTEMLGIPYGLCCSNDVIYVGSLSQGSVYTFDPHSACFEIVNNEMPVNGLKSFVVSQNSIFYNSGNSIIKSSGSGETIFVANLDAALGKIACLNFGFAVTQSTENIRLAAPDGINKCVHLFSV